MGFIIFGIIFLVTGILFIFTPRTMAKIDQLCERLLFTDKGAVKHHIVTGIFFLIVAALMFIAK